LKLFAGGNERGEKGRGFSVRIGEGGEEGGGRKEGFPGPIPWGRGWHSFVDDFAVTQKKKKRGGKASEVVVRKREGEKGESI